MENLGKLLLRLSVGGLMLLYGFHKLFHGIAGVKYLFNQAGLPSFLTYGIYLGEFVAPLLIVLGIYTRVSAFVLAGTMLVAMMVGHAADIFKLNSHGGSSIDQLLLFLFGALVIVLIGPGKYRLGKKQGLLQE
jgi:putative oxidoreductase